MNLFLIRWQMRKYRRLAGHKGLPRCSSDWRKVNGCVLHWSVGFMS